MTERLHGEFHCPNCGYYVERNFCPECGQPAHLHKESFAGLVSHFVSHYIHYESKFWITFKTLITRPGQLTIAYWQKQRMKYIPPITLYIFMSFVFFFLDYVVEALYHKIGWLTESDATQTVVREALTGMSLPQKTFQLLFSDSPASGVLFDKLDAIAPKLFFSFLPVLAFLLQLFFFRRKSFPFGNHAVFSLHFNSMFFAIWLLTVFAPEHYIGAAFSLSMFLSWLYLAVAMKRAYRISAVWSIIASVAVYMSFLLSTLVILFVTAMYFTHVYF